MPGSSPATTTRLLARWSHGDEEALAELVPRVYDELQKIAAGYLRHERPDHTLQSAALVHEAYLRLIEQQRVSWQNRSHFMGVAAQLMRRILVDHARRKAYAKRGGNVRKVSLDYATMIPSGTQTPDLLALDEALDRLSRLDAHQARIVELRYFGGLKTHEIAAATGSSVATVTRKWSLAKAWLYRTLAAE